MHQMAKRVAPNALSDLKDHLSKAKRKVVAVEKHHTDWRDASLVGHDRFLWVKARDVCTARFHGVGPLCGRAFLSCAESAHHRARAYVLGIGCFC